VLVGREPELAQGEWVVRAAESGQPETLLLVGDPGVGKTTLLEVTPDALRSLVAAGVDPGRLRYYRGGLHDWMTLGFPTVTV